MEVTYKRELDHNYLVLCQEEFEECYQVGMLVKNRIPGLLECRLSMMDEKTALYYEITSRQNLRLVLERKRLAAEELERLLEGLRKAAEICREYLLDTKKILLNPDYIYLEPDTWELTFCQFPFCEQDMQEELLKLAEYLLDRLDRQDQNAVALGYEFYRMAGETNTSLERVLTVWKEEKKKKEQEVSGKQEKQIVEKTSISKMQYPKDQQKIPLRSTSETMFLKREKEGLTLRSENPVYPDLRITGESFLIGKKKDAVDGCIKARGISRIHGKISKEGENYYLTDLNSTNGTFLNGGRLEVNEKARIREGDMVGFADVKYVVEG